MTDQETIDATRAGWGQLAILSRLIATLSLEEWLEAIQLAESAGLEFDRTLYEDAAANIQEMRGLIEAAMPLKKFVLSRKERQG